jgi:hypothetical protein
MRTLVGVLVGFLVGFNRRFTAHQRETLTLEATKPCSIVEELFDLPRFEDGPADLEPTGQHDQLAFKLPAVLKHDEHGPAALRDHRCIDHAKTVDASPETNLGERRTDP